MIIFLFITFSIIESDWWCTINLNERWFFFFWCVTKVFWPLFSTGWIRIWIMASLSIFESWGWWSSKIWSLNLNKWWKFWSLLFDYWVSFLIYWWCWTSWIWLHQIWVWWYVWMFALISIIEGRSGRFCKIRSLYLNQSCFSWLSWFRFRLSGLCFPSFWLWCQLCLSLCCFLSFFCFYSSFTFFCSISSLLGNFDRFLLDLLWHWPVITSTWSSWDTVTVVISILTSFIIECNWGDWISVSGWELSRFMCQLNSWCLAQKKSNHDLFSWFH